MNLPAAFLLLASAIIWNTNSAFGLQGDSSDFMDQDVASSGSSTGASAASSSSSSSSASSGSSPWHRVEGKVVLPLDKKNNDFLVSTQILVNGGEHIGLLKEDGTFVLDGLSPGSYVVEVINPQFHYESARVDITSKGKMRARKVNNIQPAQVTHLPYPLKLNPVGPFKYFIPREEWRITDILFSPMVLMMVLPLVLILILPKMMSDPETRKEMEQMQMPKYEMPEMSEMLTSFFGGGSEGDKKGQQKSIKSKKNN